MKAYKYNGKIYSDTKLKDMEGYGGDLQDLLYDIERDNPSIYSESTTVARYIGYDYYGTTDDKSDEETLDDIVDYGYEEVVRIYL